MDIDCLVNLLEYDPVVNGGQGRVAQELCKLLTTYSALDGLHIVFAVNANTCDEFREWLGDTQAIIIPVLPSNEFSPLLASLRPKLLISPLLGMAPFDESRYPGVPHIVTIPDTLVLDLPNVLPRREVERRWVLYRQLSRASRIVAYSQQARTSLIEHLGLTPDQVVVVPLAGVHQTAQAGPQSALPVNITTPYVFYPANGWPHKRHDLLIQIMLQVWRTEPQWKLVLTGWHPPNFIPNLIQQYQCPAERVIDLGYVSDTEVSVLYQQAEALLFVSRFECFGMPLLEAMQLGCPVICARRGAIPETVGDAALVVDSDDPARWAAALLDELPGQRDALIEKGYQRARMFSWERFQAEWAQIFDELGLTRGGEPSTAVQTIRWSASVINRELAFWSARYAEQQQQLVEKETVIQSLIQAAEAPKSVFVSLQQDLDRAHSTIQTLEQAVQQAQDSQSIVQALTQQLQDKEMVIKALTALLRQLEQDLDRAHSTIQTLEQAVQQAQDSQSIVQALNQQLQDKEVVIQALAARMRQLQQLETGHRILKIAASRLEKPMPLVQRLMTPYKNLRTPKLGQLNQYPPIPLTLPRRYSTTRRRQTSLPAIAIVTPSYNQCHFLEKTINSIFTQNYPNLEYVIQDGGSTDGTQQLLAGYRSRLTYIESVKDKGQSDAINRGFTHTTADIMAFLNADDLLLPGALEYVGNYFRTHPHVDVIYGHRIIIDAEDREIGRWVLPPHDGKVLLWADYIPQETLFWRRRIWEKSGGFVDENLQFALDWELILRFQAVGALFARLPRFLGVFRVHEKQKTSTGLNGMGQREMFLLRERYLGRVVRQSEVDQNVRSYLQHHCFYHALYRLGLVKY